MKQRKAPTPEERALGDRLKGLRQARGLRICDVSRKLDMSDQNWLLYEKGETAFKLFMLRPLAEALGMESHELFEELRPVVDSVRFNLWGVAIEAARRAGDGVLVTSVPRLDFA